jgi:hypothetical protein
MPRANRVATIPGAEDADLRVASCAFGLPRAISYIDRCHVRSPPLPTDSARVIQTYECGYGQTLNDESLGGST